MIIKPKKDEERERSILFSFVSSLFKAKIVREQGGMRGGAGVGQVLTGLT